jgi:hypothetical protein
MKIKSRTLLVSLLACSAWGYTSAGFGSDESANPQATVAAPVTDAEKAAAAHLTPAPDTTAPIEPAEYQTTTTEKAVAGRAKAAEQGTTAPVTGAFGISLGKRFAPYMVGKVIAQEEAKYTGRGEDKTEQTGTLYKVEPHIPNQYFNEYSVLTNKDGIIYSIIARQSPAEKVNACKQTKQIASLLESKYGKPRGKGVLGEWLAFRESAEGPYKGIRFYAQRCRQGRYEVVYSDDGAMMQAAAPEASNEMNGL